MKPVAAAGRAEPAAARHDPRLIELLGAITAIDTEEEALQVAAARIAESFDADAVAILSAKMIPASIGLQDLEAREALMALELRADSTLLLPGLGECSAVSMRIGEGHLERLVLARRGDGLDPDELELLRGMAQALGLLMRLTRSWENERRLREEREAQSMENERLVERLAERQRLFQRLSLIQRQVVSHSDLAEVLDAIVTGAYDLLGDETVGLRLIDEDDPSQVIMVASRGVPDELLRSPRSPVGSGAGGRAIAEDRLVVIDDYAASDTALAGFVSEGIRTAMGCPVHERGRVVGSLVVATHSGGRTYSELEQEILRAFAGYASLALSDARAIGEAIEQAHHDPLTGLPNRLLLEKRLQSALRRAELESSCVAVLFCDLDAFKTVNDSLGHAAGDELLVAAAERISTCLRPPDMAARFGGDEFVILLEGLAASEAEPIAARIAEQIERPFTIRGREVYVSASVGIAAGASQGDDLLRDADLALFEAKAGGRARRAFYRPEMHSRMLARVDLEEEIARGLRRGEFELFHQPVVRLLDGRLTACEALIRWRHPLRGLIGPGEFIPVAEAGRLIFPLGRWVITEAARELARMRRRFGELVMHVNLSAVQLDDPKLPETISAALDNAGLPPDAVVFELTETSFIRDETLIANRLADIRRIGSRIAVDDFGTGNASLRHLSRYPIDVLKIDRSFIDRVEHDERQAAIAQSIIALGEDLGMSVVAEGIESEHGLRFVTELGCGYGQGFHIARPAPATELRPLLDRAAGDEPLLVPAAG